MQTSNNELSSEQIAKSMEKMKNDPDYIALSHGVDNTSFDKANFHLNTSVESIYNSLLTNGTNNLVTLYRDYFKDHINASYTIDDVYEITELIKPTVFNDIKNHPKFAIVKNENYKNDYKYLEIVKLYKENTDEYRNLVGASTIDYSLWFYFANDKTDVNNGTIFIRRSMIQKVKKLSTFEINTFVSKQVGEKNVLTFNPNWLISTIESMKKAVFSLLKQ